jgi:hypothetical protein
LCSNVFTIVFRDRARITPSFAPTTGRVSDEVYERIAKVAHEVGTERLKSIFLALGEQVPYDPIRLVVTHMNCASPDRG